MQIVGKLVSAIVEKTWIEEGSICTQRVALSAEQNKSALGRLTSLVNGAREKDSIFVIDPADPYHSLTLSDAGGRVYDLRVKDRLIIFPSGEYGVTRSRGGASEMLDSFLKGAAIIRQPTLSSLRAKAMGGLVKE